MLRDIVIIPDDAVRCDAMCDTVDSGGTDAFTPIRDQRGLGPGSGTSDQFFHSALALALLTLQDLLSLSCILQLPSSEAAQSLESRL